MIETEREAVGVCGRSHVIVSLDRCISVSRDRMSYGVPGLTMIDTFVPVKFSVARPVLVSLLYESVLHLVRTCR